MQVTFEAHSLSLDPICFTDSSVKISQLRSSMMPQTFCHILILVWPSSWWNFDIDNASLSDSSALKWKTNSVYYNSFKTYQHGNQVPYSRSSSCRSINIQSVSTDPERCFEEVIIDSAKTGSHISWRHQGHIAEAKWRSLDYFFSLEWDRKWFSLGTFLI